MKKYLKYLGYLILFALLYLLFWPVGIDPVAFTPPPNPGLKGVFEKNNKLGLTKILLQGEGIGPECIAMSSDSFLYTGWQDGKITKFTLEGKKVSDFANTGGRPLGLQFDKNDNLIVGDEYKGLLSINPKGEVEVLADEVDGTKIFFADDLDIASDGTIYFTDASQRNHDIETEVWELQPSGRLISYNPNNKTTKIELDSMRFPNGVAFGPNEEFLLVNETFGMAIHKLWLKGTKTGQTEIFTNSLPGYPDNITYNGNGIFWIAIPSVRVPPEFEALFEKPFLRKIAKRLPRALTAAQEPPPFGMIIAMDLNGDVRMNMQDTTGRIHHVTSVIQIDKSLYIGSLEMDGIGKLDL